MDLTAAATLFAWLDREIWLVTACNNNLRGGLIATQVEPLSLAGDFPRVLVGLARQHHTWELVEASRAFTLHLLAEENLELVWRFGLESARNTDKFEGLDLTTTESGHPVLTQTIGWLDCRVEASLDIGDRTLYVAEVLEGRVLNFAPPLTSRKLMELAPTTRLTQLQRKRHLDSYCEAEAIRTWRNRQGAPGGTV